MEIPKYIIQEVLIRLEEFNKEIGAMRGFKREESLVIVRTANGTTTMPVTLLKSQFHAPAKLLQTDMENLAKQFIQVKRVAKKLSFSYAGQ